MSTLTSMKSIPVARPSIGVEEEKAVLEVLRSGWLAQGARVAEFEKRFAEYVGAAHAVAVSSCTTGLHLALVAAGVQPGDEVLCPSLSFIATANSIRYAAATPVFVDIDPATYNMDPACIEAAITPRTRAILVVHQVGLPSALSEICEIAHATAWRWSRMQLARSALSTNNGGLDRLTLRWLVLAFIPGSF